MEGPIFVPPHQAQFYEIFRAQYEKARAEASRIAASKGITMRVEMLKPVHLNLTEYKLPVGDKTYTLKENRAIFPVGILNLDTSFDYMKWWKGAKVAFLAEWFTLPVAYFQEKQGAYKGNLDLVTFRGSETFTFSCHSTTEGATTVNAWLLAFVVLPAGEAESPIVA